MTSTPSPAHTPAVSLGSANPWLVWLAGLAGVTILAGAIAVGSNADTGAYDWSPVWYALGMTWMGGGFVLLTGLLVAGAVGWQLRRR